MDESNRLVMITFSWESSFYAIDIEEVESLGYSTRIMQKGLQMGRRYKLAGNDDLWQCIIRKQNTIFYTAKGLPFTYSIKTLPDGTAGNEIMISRRSKLITRATIDIAYQRVNELGKITGPKQIGVFGASYLYAIFKGIGIINETAKDNEPA